MKSQDDISMLELLTVLSMKYVISFVCTEVPFLVDAPQVSLGSLQPVIFSLEISVMFSSQAGPDINHQDSRDRKLAIWKSEHIITMQTWREYYINLQDDDKTEDTDWL